MLPALHSFLRSADDEKRLVTHRFRRAGILQGTKEETRMLEAMRNQALEEDLRFEI